MLRIPNAWRQIASRPSTVRGMAWMLLSCLVVAIFNSIVRHVTQEVHPFQVVFIHSSFGLLFMSPLLLRHGLAPLRTRRPGMHLARATVNVAAALFMNSALKITPMAKVAALSFSAPLFATVLAVVLIGERIRLRRLIALAAGFAGTWAVFRPGMVELDLGSMLVLGFAVSWGSTLIIMKTLTRTESVTTMTLYVNLLNIPFGLMFAAPVWVTPTLEQFAWLALLGLCGVARQFTLSLAFKDADATAILPLDFTKLLWMAAIGYLLFAEIPDLWTWIGGAIIFASTTYITYRENQARRAAEAPRRAAEAPPAPP